MKVIVFILGIAIGAAIAFILNTLLAAKVEKKSFRLAMQVTTYIVCILLSVFFIFFGSLRTILDTFIDGRILYIEQTLNRLSPEENIMEKNIDTAEIYSVLSEAQEIVDGEKSEGIIEKIIIRSFTGTLSKYVGMTKDSVAELTEFNNSDGTVTVKSILGYIKLKTLAAASPYFIFGQIASVLLLVIYIGIYIAIVRYLKKGGALYNKSIVFGDKQENET